MSAAGIGSGRRRVGVTAAAAAAVSGALVITMSLAPAATAGGGGGGPTPPGLPGELTCADTTITGATTSAPVTLGTGPKVCDMTFTTPGTGSGSITLSRGITSADVIVVGGGGGGGAGTTTNNGGGGGGGGQVVAQTVSVSPLTPMSVNVADGGAAGSNGGQSSIASVTALGGAAGVSAGTTANGGAAGGNGGNGGGSGVTGPTTVNGISVTAAKVAGGGGGAGSAGIAGSASTGKAGDGGLGLTPTHGFFANNTSTYGAGGGGGGAIPMYQPNGVVTWWGMLPQTAGDGTPLVSGYGANSDQSPGENKRGSTGGYANTGGGGGGGLGTAAASPGGSGIVRLRYKLPVQVRYIIDSTHGWESLDAYGTTATIDDDTDPNGWQATNPGYTFAGWSTNSNGSTLDYVAGDTVTRTGYLPLYPVWTPLGATAPSGLTASSVTASSSTFTWTNPSSGSWTASQLAWRAGSSGPWTLVGSAGNASTATVALPAGTTVQVMVIGTYGSGSLSSSALTVVVPAASSGSSTPSAPTTSAPTTAPTTAPSQAPATPAAPTPVPGGMIMPTGPLAPSLPGSNPNLPASGVPLGGSVMLVNGQPQTLTVTPAVVPIDGTSAASAPTALSIEGNGFTMSIAGIGPSGRPLGLTADGALILEPDRRAAVQGTGFQPDSDVELYLFSEPRYVGRVTTDASGNFKGAVPLPSDVPTGRHTLQTNGFTPDGQVRSISLGVQLNVAAPVARKEITSRSTVEFTSLSSTLTSSARSTLRALVRKTGTKATTITVVGYVQRSASESNDAELSRARAASVTAFLRSLGLQGAYRVKAGGVAPSRMSDPRSASVAVTLVR